MTKIASRRRAKERKIRRLFPAATLGDIQAVRPRENRLRDRFSGSKSRQVTGQSFSGPNFISEIRTSFLDGDRIQDRF